MNHFHKFQHILSPLNTLFFRWKLHIDGDCKIIWHKRELRREREKRSPNPHSESVLHSTHLMSSIFYWNRWNRRRHLFRISCAVQISVFREIPDCITSPIDVRACFAFDQCTCTVSLFLLHFPPTHSHSVHSQSIWRLLSFSCTFFSHFLLHWRCMDSVVCRGKPKINEWKKSQRYTQRRQELSLLLFAFHSCFCFLLSCSLCSQLVGADGIDTHWHNSQFATQPSNRTTLLHPCQ